MTTFTDVFGGDTVPPSENSYVAHTLTVSGELVWPFNYSGTDLLSADIIEVSAGAGLTLTLPPADGVSVGEDILIRNTGANSVEILDNGGGSLTTIDAGAVKLFYVTNNSTAAGVWGIFGYGAGVSSADAAALASYGLKVLSGRLAVDYPYIEKNGNYTVLSSDRARLINVTAGSITLSLPQSSSVGAGFFVMVRNTSIGAITVDPFNTENVNGELTFEMAPGESAVLVNSGSGWYTVGYGRDVEFTFSEFVINAAAGSVMLSSTDVSGRMIRVGGTATGNITVTLPAIDNIYFVNVESGMGAFTATFTTGSGSVVVLLANQRTALYCDGTNVTAAITTSLVSTIALDDGSAAVPTLFFVLDTNTGMFRRAEGELGITSNGVEVAYFGADGLHADGVFIENVGVGNSFVVEDSASPDSSPFVIDAAGRVIAGHTASIVFRSALAATGQFIETTGQLGIGIDRSSADANPGNFVIRKSRGATPGAVTIVQSGDGVGGIFFTAADGVAPIDCASISAAVDGTPGVNDMPGRLTFSTTADGASTSTERMRINSSGQILVGHTASITGTGGLTPRQQLSGTTISTSSQSLNAFSVTSTDAATLQLNKSANAAVGSHTIVVDGEQVGNIYFSGSDGAAFIRTAMVRSEVDGTPGLNDMPGRLIFGTTADGGTVPTERMRIDSTGKVSISANNSTGALTINQLGSGHALLVEDSASPDATPFLVEGSGMVIAGHTSAQTTKQYNNAGSVTPFIQQHGVDLSTTTIATSFWANNAASCSEIILSKSRGAVGVQTIVQNADVLGALVFNASDGVAFQTAATILAAVDAAPGANDMPGRLMFNTTPDGSVTPTERMRITSSGNLLIGTTADDGTRLQVSGNAVISSQLRFSSAAASILNANNTGQIDIDHAPVDGTSVGLIRFYRNTTTTGAVRVGISPGDGTATFNHLLVGKGADTYLCGLSGNLFISSTVSITGTGGIVPKVQISGTSTATSSQSLNTFSVTDTEAATFQLNKSGNATIGSHTIVASGEQLGNVYFSGSDGVGFIRGAMIRSEVDGTPGVNDMPGRLIFGTTADGASSPSERMRIVANGNVLIGTTTDNAVGKIQISGQSTYTATAFYSQTTTSTPGVGNTTEGGAIQISGAAAIFRGSRTSGPSLTLNRNTTDGSVAEFHRDGVAVGSISVTTTATAYNTSSDYRLKSGVQDLVGSGSFIDALRPRSWTWNSTGGQGAGFIAHELQTVSPASVTGRMDEIDEEGNPVYQAVEYGSAEVIAMMVAELKSLRQRVATLEAN